jgi:hypothetical protein
LRAEARSSQTTDWEFRRKLLEAARLVADVPRPVDAQANDRFRRICVIVLPTVEGLLTETKRSFRVAGVDYCSCPEADLSGDS